jgi:transcriptional regulator with XRE-family HTH domain
MFYLDLRVLAGIATLFLLSFRFFIHVWKKKVHTVLQSQQKIGTFSSLFRHEFGTFSSKSRQKLQFLCIISALFRHCLKNIIILSALTIKCRHFFAIKPGDDEIFCYKLYMISGLFSIMATTEAEKQEILRSLKDGRKISDISDQMGISRDTIRKIKNAGAANPKPDLSNFEKTFEVTGSEITAEGLLKSIGSLAPKILKERLEAGELCLSICGSAAQQSRMSLEEYLKVLLLFPAELEQARVEIQNLIEINQQLQNVVDRQMDNVVITKSIDRVMAHALTHGRNQINLDVIFAYGQFLQRLRTEDPQFFNHMRTLASEPIPQVVGGTNPT